MLRKAAEGRGGSSFLTSRSSKSNPHTADFSPTAELLHRSQNLPSPKTTGALVRLLLFQNRTLGSVALSFYELDALGEVFKHDWNRFCSCLGLPNMAGACLAAILALVG